MRKQLFIAVVANLRATEAPTANKQNWKKEMQNRITMQYGLGVCDRCLPPPLCLCVGRSVALLLLCFSSTVVGLPMSFSTFLLILSVSNFWKAGMILRCDRWKKNYYFKYDRVLMLIVSHLVVLQKRARDKQKDHGWIDGGFGLPPYGGR